jgi:HD-GYP domain-containing protein (c-di-GMP phosphodiesterase class II)
MEPKIAFIGSLDRFSISLSRNFSHYDNLEKYRLAKQHTDFSIVVMSKEGDIAECVSLCLEGNNFIKPYVSVFIVEDADSIQTVNLLTELGADFVFTRSQAVDLDKVVKLATNRLNYKKKMLKFVNFLTDKQASEEALLHEKIQQISQQFKAVIVSITNALGIKSEYTGGHSKRVANLCIKFGKKMGFKEYELQMLEYSGLLHDIGKIGVPDNILNKPGKLTEEEYEEVKKHSIYAGYILKDIPGFEIVKEAAMHEHERFDGKGYPTGLKQEEIPLYSRIIAICDTWDSLVIDRVYRKATTKELALEEIKKNVQTQFDPVLVEIFEKMVENNEV